MTLTMESRNVSTHFQVFELSSLNRSATPELLFSSASSQETLNYLSGRVLTIQICGWEVTEPIPGVMVCRFPDAKPHHIDQIQVWVEFPDWFLDNAVIPDWCRAPIGAPQ